MTSDSGTSARGTPFDQLAAVEASPSEELPAIHTLASLGTAALAIVSGTVAAADQYAPAASASVRCTSLDLSGFTIGVISIVALVAPAGIVTTPAGAS